MTVTVAIDLPVDLDTAWQEIETIEDHVYWMADAERLEFATEQRRGVGTEIVVATRVGPFRTSDRMLFTEWVDHVRLSVEHKGLFTGQGSFSLDGIDDSTTRLTWEEEIRFPWYLGGRLGAALAQPVLRWIWARNLRRLSSRLSSR
jgi:hypothetical protein